MRNRRAGKKFPAPYGMRNPSNQKHKGDPRPKARPADTWDDKNVSKGARQWYRAMDRMIEKGMSEREIVRSISKKFKIDPMAIKKELRGRMARMANEFEADSDGNYMSVQNIQTILNAANFLADMIEDGDEMEDWVEDKISVARSALSDVARYYDSGRMMYASDKPAKLLKSDFDIPVLFDNDFETTLGDIIKDNQEEGVEPVTEKEARAIRKLKEGKSSHIGMIEIKRLPEKGASKKATSRTFLAHSYKEALRKIEVQKLMSQGQFSLITAYRNENSKSENKRLQTELRVKLAKMGYKPETLKASWDGKTEQSLLVKGIPFGKAKALGIEYGQDAIIWKGAGEPWVGMYYFNGKNAGKVEVALDTKNLSVDYDMSMEKDLYSKARGLSFELDFHWGKFVNTGGGAIKPKHLEKWFEEHFGMSVTVSNNQIII